MTFESEDEAAFWRDVYLAALRGHQMEDSETGKDMTMNEVADAAVVSYRDRRTKLDASSGPYR